MRIKSERAVKAGRRGSLIIKNELDLTTRSPNKRTRSVALSCASQVCEQKFQLLSWSFHSQVEISQCNERDRVVRIQFERTLEGFFGFIVSLKFDEQLAERDVGKRPFGM